MKEEENIIIYTSKDGKASVSLFAQDGQVWMTQNQLAELFSTSKQNIGQHITSIINDNELDENSVIKKYFTTAADGKKYEVSHYSLEMILAIGFRVRSKRGVQFRVWANQNLKEYMVKGFVMDKERLKNPDGRADYFDELLANIRDIRSSEKRFYQKVRDLFALSTDYDTTDKATQMFFAETQNKLIFASTQKTAAELIVERADSDKSNMALTSWKGRVVRKQDIFIAKNYLIEDEIDTLNRLVTIFLESAELRAKTRKSFTMSFWQENVDKVLSSNDFPLLEGKGSISKKEVEEEVSEIYKSFEQRRKQEEVEQADFEDMQELKIVEEEIKRRNFRDHS
ncbi:virulence RhuM family protein [Lentisphaera profundi]|uniref:Virulence RhuM family protein n=1 Tax=Lentisphaera profundi TaxID=1658616 RepID=A0ABY7VUI0_9BACT|nr:virulence RhuM family protein [Lentisphaera profundi]WDE96959.1 virulence RhuM family protein [Lentisphaera profundi]